MNVELIAHLLSWAVFYTDYPMPDQLPVIDYVTHEYIVNTSLCNGIDTVRDPCTARAFYDDGNTGHLVIDEKFKDNVDGYSKSIIVHEMVHYLQDLTGDWKDIADWDEPIRCQERSFRQREAYMVQDKYNLDVHGKRRLLPRRYDKCGM